MNASFLGTKTTRLRNHLSSIPISMQRLIGRMAYCVQLMNAYPMSENPISEEIHLRVLRLLADNPEISQRELAEQLGVSLGKTNYCLKALMDTGSIKVRNFRNSSNKAGYAYCLTPKGLRTKAGLTRAFLGRKLQEYEALKREIELLRQEDGAATSPPTM